MLTDTHLLRYYIQKNGDTVESLAAYLGIGRTALSCKMNNRSEFKQGEILRIAERYKLNAEACMRLFFGGVAA